jgi:hypothetical protein
MSIRVQMGVVTEMPRCSVTSCAVSVVRRWIMMPGWRRLEREETETWMLGFFIVRNPQRAAASR